jgi:hypothetical protein
MSGDASCEAITSEKPSPRATSAARRSCAGWRKPCRKTIATLSMAPCCEASEIHREPRLVELAQHGALGSDPLCGLDRFRVERRREPDVEVEEPRAILVANRERIAEAGRRDECRRHDRGARAGHWSRRSSRCG